MVVSASAPSVWHLVAPFLAGLATIVAAMVADMAGTSRTGTLTAAIGTALSACVAAWSGATTMSGLVVDEPLNGVLAAGGYVAYMTALLYALACAGIVAGWRRLAVRRDGAQIAVLMASSALASACLMASRDLLLFVIALEAVALIGFALVASARTARSGEAAMKYFVQGAVVTAVLLYGVAILFGVYGGTLRFDELVWQVRGPVEGPMLLALVFVASALSFKLGAVPFHSWAPDAFETAPAPAAAVAASVPKVAALVVGATLFSGVFFETAPLWTVLFAVVATLSIVVGNFGGLKQVSYSRMLGYSGIAQAGYALAVFVTLDLQSFSNLSIMPGLADPVAMSGGLPGMSALKFFALTYALAAAGAFVAAEAIREVEPGWDGTIPGLAGLARRRPGLAMAVGICMLSLTGIPLTAGFWGKYLVFVRVILDGWTWIAFVGFIGSVISFGYYGSVLKSMYLESSDDDAGEGQMGPAGWTLVVLAVAVTALGVLPLFLGLDRIGVLLTR